MSSHGLPYRVDERDHDGEWENFGEYVHLADARRAFAYSCRRPLRRIVKIEMRESVLVEIPRRIAQEASDA